MKRRLALRLLAWVASIMLVHAAAFFMLRSTRGGPFDQSRALDPVVMQALQQRYGLDDPPALQYLHAVQGLLHGDFGPSLRYRDTQVSTLLAEAFPVSLLLGSGALLLALLFGIPAGLHVARRRHQNRHSALPLCGTVFLSLPNFAIAAALLVLFSFHSFHLPPAGWGQLRYLLLPWLSLSIPLAAQIMFLVRSRAEEAYQSLAVRQAMAAGLSPRHIRRHYILRPSLSTVCAFLGPAAAAVLTGSLVIEQIFALPGLGTFFVQAALARDYTLALGVTVVYTALLGFCTLLADIATSLLDPRMEALS